MISCANLLVKHELEYIVLKRSAKKQFAPNLVVPFGGKISRGESPFEASIRELKEESGLTAKNIKLAAIVTEVHNDPEMKGDWLVYYFVGDFDKGELNQNPEGTSLKLTKKELMKQELFPTFQILLPYLMKKELRPIVARVSFDKNRKITSYSLDIC